MILTYEQVLNRLAERTHDNTKQLRKMVQQRRNGMEDLYGICFSAEGDANNPATFYVSLSPDFIYLQQFAFKFVIRPYSTTVTGGTDSASVTVDNTSLLVNNNDIEPNPHTHGTQPHTHNLITGKSFIQTTSDYWRVHMDGVDLTPYFMEQHDGEWIDMEGESGAKIFPNDEVDSVEDFYDVLAALSAMIEEDTEESLANAEKILRPNKLKKVEIISDAPFGVDAYLYEKYDHLNR